MRTAEDVLLDWSIHDEGTHLDGLGFFILSTGAREPLRADVHFPKVTA